MFALLMIAALQAPMLKPTLDVASAPIFVEAVDDLAASCPTQFRDGFAPGDVVAPRRCRIAESGQIGTVDRDTYFYGIYCVDIETEPRMSCGEDEGPMTSLNARSTSAVFVRRRGEEALRILDAVTYDGLVRFGRPVLAATPAGVMLQHTRASGASCDCNVSDYYLWRPRDRSWVAIDFTSWQRTLTSRLPPGVHNMDAPWPDLTTLTVRGLLWAREDAHCCPSAGAFSARLTVSGNQFVLTTLQVQPVPVRSPR